MQDAQCAVRIGFLVSILTPPIFGIIAKFRHEVLITERSVWMYVLQVGVYIILQIYMEIAICAYEEEEEKRKRDTLKARDEEVERLVLEIQNMNLSS